MADEFTTNQVQGVFGEFKAVLDFATVTVTANNVQGVFGEFKSVLDEAAEATLGGRIMSSLVASGGLSGTGGVAGKGGGLAG